MNVFSEQNSFICRGLTVHFSKGDIHMSNKYMKRYSTSLAIRKMQIEATMRYHFTCIRMAIFKKKQKNNKCWQGCGEIGTFIHAGGSVIWCSHFAKQSDCSWKIKHRVSIWPSNSASRYIAKRNENICPHKNLYMDVHSNIDNNQRMGTLQCPPTNEWRNKMWFIQTM